MKYEKAMVTIIDLGEEDIVTMSTACSDSTFAAANKCGDDNHFSKFYNCTSNGHMNHGGQ